MATASTDGKVISLVASYAQRDLAIAIPGSRWNKDAQLWEMPLTWAACIQLRGLFGAGLEVTEELRKWAWSEKLERINPAMELRGSLGLPASVNDVTHITHHVTQALVAIENGSELKLKPFQRADVAFLVACGQAGLFSQPGTGKTAVTIRTLQVLARMGLDPFPALIVCPNSLKNTVWKAEMARWAPELSVTVVNGPVNTRRKQIAAGSDITVINYESLRLHTREEGYGTIRLSEKAKAKKELNERGFRTVVADECVPYDTVLTTPDGDVPVSEINSGDLVLGVDHMTGDQVWTEVRGVRRSPLRPLVRFGPAQVTVDHPVWLADDGRPCYASAYGQERRTRLRTVRGELHLQEQRQARDGKILLAQLCEQVQQQPPVVQEAGCAGHAGTCQEAGCCGKTSPASSWTGQSVQEPGSAQEIDRGKCDCDWVAAPEGRKRHGSYYPAAEAVGRARRAVGGGVRSEGVGENSGIPDKLQAGRGTSWLEDRDRGSGEQPQSEVSASTGREEEVLSRGTWLDGNLGDERGNPGGSLWNVETTTGNYFANGVLVHNCHRLRHTDTALTRSTWAVMHDAEFRFGLTGTPVNDHCGDLWGLMHGILPDWFPRYTRYVSRYGLVGYNWYGGTEILGLRPETATEFRAVTEPAYRRVLKEAVLPQLPPKLPPQVRETLMTPKQMKAYQAMEQNLLTILENGEILAAPSALAQMTRLLQFAAASAEINSKGELKLSDPSGKVDDLMEFLEELGEDEPLVVAAVSRQLIELAAKRLTEKKIRHGLVTGAQSTVERAKAVADFQEGRSRVILLTLGAGAEGLTLTRASTILFMQRSWSPLVNQQAEDRVHRIGSEVHESIRIVYQVTPGTVEARVQEVLSVKDWRIEEVIQDRETLRKLLGG